VSNSRATYTPAMSKRLQVVLDDDEFADLQRAADREHLTLSGWVRRALRDARGNGSTDDIETRLGAVRSAMRHSFPTADIDQMLDEVRQGRMTS